MAFLLLGASIAHANHNFNIFSCHNYIIIFLLVLKKIKCVCYFFCFVIILLHGSVLWLQKVKRYTLELHTYISISKTHETSKLTTLLGIN